MVMLTDDDNGDDGDIDNNDGDGGEDGEDDDGEKLASYIVHSHQESPEKYIFCPRGGGVPKNTQFDWHNMWTAPKWFAQRDCYRAPPRIGWKYKLILLESVGDYQLSAHDPLPRSEL